MLRLRFGSKLQQCLIRSAARSDARSRIRPSRLLLCEPFKGSPSPPPGGAVTPCYIETSALLYSSNSRSSSTPASIPLPSRRRATPARSALRDAGVNCSASLRAASAFPIALEGVDHMLLFGGACLLFYFHFYPPRFLGPLKIIYLPLRRRSWGLTSMRPTPRPLNPAAIPHLSSPPRHCLSTLYSPQLLLTFTPPQQRPFSSPPCTRVMPRATFSVP